MKYSDIFEINSLLEIRKDTLKDIINFSNQCNLNKHPSSKSCIKRLESDIKTLKTKTKDWNREYSYHYDMFLKLNSNLLLLNKKKYDSKDLRMFYNCTEQGKMLCNKEQCEFFKIVD